MKTTPPVKRLVDPPQRLIWIGNFLKTFIEFSVDAHQTRWSVELETVSCGKGPQGTDDWSSANVAAEWKVQESEMVREVSDVRWAGRRKVRTKVSNRRTVTTNLDCHQRSKANEWFAVVERKAFWDSASQWTWEFYIEKLGKQRRALKSHKLLSCWPLLNRQ